MAEKTWINIGGVNKEAIPWINVNGTWKQCIPWINVNGVWKACYEDGSNGMTVYIPATGDSSSRSQSRVITIPGLANVISCTVDTGSVSYTVSGTSVTLNVSNGASVRSSTPFLTVNDSRQTSAGGDPASLPSSISHNSGGYSGTLYAQGNAYVVSGSPPDSRTGTATLSTVNPGDPPSKLPDYYSYNYQGYSGQIPAIAPAYVASGAPGGSKYCTGTDLVYFVVVNGDLQQGSTKSTIPYNDGEYSGNLNYIGVDPLYQANCDAHIYALTHGTSWSGYIKFQYGATLSKPDTRIWERKYSGTVHRPDTQVWKKDYSGTVYGPTTYYYAYVVNIKYTTI